ncbi:MAG: glucose-1-phosphate cytidylyltransferase [Bacteroidia bacterium]|nr:glucose-1-phosphate cytidylyltransferase [Bacteroidia bacterium]
MKALILAGGIGSRLSEETTHTPKPLVEIGGKPIIWHIMRIYAHAGIKEFIILVGYKGGVFFEKFSDYTEDDWKVTILETGDGTLKSQRIKQAEKLIAGEDFFVAYGDDLSDINPIDVYNEHKSFPERVVTLTAMPLESNYGILEINENNAITQFREKPRIEGYWINGGFFCFSGSIFEYLNNPKLELEDDIFKILAKENRIGAYKHKGFWKSMNTQKEKLEMEELVRTNEAKWIKW